MGFMKKNGFFIAVCLLFFATALSGCAELKDKFVRKKKEDPHAKSYYAVRKYDVHPTLELYTKRYVFWKNWHREVLDVIDHDNQKKVKVAIEQEISNLMDMQNMLVDEKADAMQKPIDEMIEVERTIKTNGVTSGNKVRIRRSLENLGKEIKRDFTYTKMRGFIADDFRGKEPIAD